MPRLQRDGASIEYDVAGSGERTVLFSHNLLCDRSVFAHAFERVSSRVRAINVDNRAHGGSRATRAFTVPEVAGDLLAVLDAEKVARATIVGLSLGSSAALELALAEPQRVDALVLFGATPLAASSLDSLKNSILGAAVRALGTRSTLVRPALPVLFGRTFRESEPAKIAAWERKLVAFGGANLWRAVRAWQTRPSLLERLGKIRARTLVVVGEEDAAHPPALGELIHSKIAGSRLERVAHAGHTMTFERPEETTALVERFLDGV